MPEFKVTAYIHNAKMCQGSSLVGKMTLATNDHKLASKFASNFECGDDDYHANVDFEMRVPMGRRSIWLDASPTALDAAADYLMRAASELRAAQHGVKIAAE